MQSEDKALDLLQGINREIVSILSDLKANKSDLDSMDSASNTKLEELLDQIKQVKSHIDSFIRGNSKQTTLDNY
mgnify:FL=1|tara:strand:+ start:718 stop:939 length:222 start_codon:yes stop_codon:yes gene_type:complete